MLFIPLEEMYSSFYICMQDLRVLWYPESNIDRFDIYCAVLLSAWMIDCIIIIYGPTVRTRGGPIDNMQVREQGVNVEGLKSYND